jgi:hypothetical protein
MKRPHTIIIEVFELLNAGKETELHVSNILIRSHSQIK